MLLDPIAVGGMAELFRAKIMGDEGFQKLVAVKKILPHLVGEKALIDAFIDEARLAAYLQHENIVRTYDFGRMGNDFFIAMEYLFGKNLRMAADQAAQTGKTLPLDLCLYIISRVAKGLDYAHDLKDFSGKRLNIVHRDISPPNIFITYEGEVKVVDFGVAKAASRNTTTLAGVIKGKVAYMSPEQADGAEIDHRTDIFAVGAVLYELLTGARMYSGDTFQVLARARKAEFAPARQLAPLLPESVCQVLDKALALDPAKRYQRCSDMQADIEDALYDLSMRTNQRALSKYIRELFEADMAEEEQSLQEAALLDVSQGAGVFRESVGSAPTAYDRTEVFDSVPEPRFFPPTCVPGPDAALSPEVMDALASLEPQDAPRAHFILPDRTHYLLVPGTCLLFGRKRDINHVPAFLFPEAGNEEKNVKASRNHFSLTVKKRDAFIRDTSANGTFLSGRRLPRGQDIRLEAVNPINVGGILDFTTSLYTDGKRIVCVGVTRENNRQNERYVLMPSFVPIGSTENVPIRIQGAPRFLALIYFNPLESLWRLRTISGFSGPPRDVALKSSQVIAFGPVSCRFEAM